MSPARPLRPAPSADRPARWVIAMTIAALAVTSVAVPVLAVDPGSSPAPDASASASPSPLPTASTAPSATPSASPSASATPSVSPSASPSSTPTPTPTPTPTATWPTTITSLGSSVRFYGRGYGHGVGLNQHGARGRALSGQTAAQILAAYYKGSKPATVSPTTNVRVLLMSGYRAISTAPLVIRGRITTWRVSGIDKEFPIDGVLKVWRTTSTVDGVTRTTWRVRAYAPDGTTLLHSGTVPGSVWVSGTGSTSRLELVSKPSTYDTYRGRFRLVLGASTVNVVNHVPLDTYLRGVVPVEMPSTWPAEALKAQVVAARSYAVRRLRPGTGTFDIYDDTRSQVYRGQEAERTATNRLIADNPGQILMYGTSVVNAFFFSTGGGATENNEYAFVSSSGAVGTAVSYLRGIQDRMADGTAYDAAAPYYAWSTSSLTRATLSAMFKADARTNVGDLTKLDLRKRGVSGRLYQVTLHGSLGTKTVSADVFRSVYNAKRPAGTLPLRGNMFNTRPLPAQ